MHFNDISQSHNISGSVDKRSNSNFKSLFDKNSLKCRFQQEQGLQGNKILSEFNEEKQQKCNSNFIYENAGCIRSNIMVLSDNMQENTKANKIYSSSIESNSSLVRISNNNLNAPIKYSCKSVLKHRKYSKDDSNLNSMHHSERTDKSNVSVHSNMQEIYGKLLLRRINPVSGKKIKRENSN